MNLECMMYDDRLRPYDRIPPNTLYPLFYLINLFASTTIARILHSSVFRPLVFLFSFPVFVTPAFHPPRTINHTIIHNSSHTDFRHAISPVTSLIKKALNLTFPSIPPFSSLLLIKSNIMHQSFISFNFYDLHHSQIVCYDFLHFHHMFLLSLGCLDSLIFAIMSTTHLDVFTLEFIGSYIHTLIFTELVATSGLIPTSPPCNNPTILLPGSASFKPFVFFFPY